MRNTFMILFLLSVCLNLSAQEPCKRCDNIEFNWFRNIKDSVCAQIKQQTVFLDSCFDSDSTKFVLVTDFTFRRKFANEFAEILIQENSFSNLNRHASLKVDDNESKVSFSPFVFRNGKVGFSRLKFYGSVEFAAEINDQQIFKLFDKDGLNRSFQLNVNFNYIPNFWNGGNFIANSRQYHQFSYWRECAREKICSNYEKIFDSSDTCGNVTSLADEVESFCDTSKFRDKIWNKFADYEEKLARGYWTKDLKSWFSLALTPYGYTENNGVDINTANLKRLDYYSPAFKLIFNQLLNYLCTNRSLYWNVWLDLKQKNSFSERNPLKWNNVLRLSDTTFAIKEIKDAYLYDPANYTLRFLPSFGGQFIYIHSFKLLEIGIDLTYKYSILPRLRPGENNYKKNTLTAGIIFPFDNKDGERLINFEPYFSFSFFSAKDLDNEKFIGLKFSVPIFSR